MRRSEKQRSMYERSSLVRSSSTLSPGSKGLAQGQHANQHQSHPRKLETTGAEDFVPPPRVKSVTGVTFSASNNVRTFPIDRKDSPSVHGHPVPLTALGEAPRKPSHGLGFSTTLPANFGVKIFGDQQDTSVRRSSILNPDASNVVRKSLRLNDVVDLTTVRFSPHCRIPYQVQTQIKCQSHTI